MPLYASLNMMLGAEQIGVLMTVALVANALLSFPSGWLSDKVGRKPPIMVSVLSSAFLILLIPFQRDVNNLTALMIVFGVASGLRGSIFAWPADIVSPEKLGTAVGLYRLVGDLGNFLGPIVVTYVNDYFNTNLIVPQSFLIPGAIAIVAGIALMGADDPSKSGSMDVLTGYSRGHTKDTFSQRSILICRRDASLVCSQELY